MSSTDSFSTIHLTSVTDMTTMFNTSNITTTVAVPQVLIPGFMYFANGWPVTYFYFFFNLFFFCFCTVSMIMNIIVAMILFQPKNQTENIEFTVASLACCDAMYMFDYAWGIVYNLTNVQNDFECQARLCVMWCGTLLGGNHIALLSLDRLVKITWPFKYNQIFTPRNIRIFTGLIVLVNVIIGFLPMMGFRKYLDPELTGGVVCIFMAVTDVNFLRLYTCCFSINYIVMCVSYITIFVVARGQSRKIADAEKGLGVNNPTSKTESVFDSQAWKFTKTFAIVVLFYAAMCLSAGAVLFMKTLGQLDHIDTLTQGTYIIYSAWGIVVNSIVNPIIYAIKIKSVNENFKRIFCWCRS